MQGMPWGQVPNQSRQTRGALGSVKGLSSLMKKEEDQGRHLVSTSVLPSPHPTHVSSTVHTCAHNVHTCIVCNTCEQNTHTQFCKEILERISLQKNNEKQRVRGDQGPVIPFKDLPHV